MVSHSTAKSSQMSTGVGGGTRQEQGQFYQSEWANVWSRWFWGFGVFFNLFKKIDFIFKSTFWFTVKWGRRYRGFPYTSYSHTCMLPLLSHRSPEWNVSTKDKPTLTHRVYVKSIAYLRIYCWYCPFYGLGQMYTNLYPSL